MESQKLSNKVNMGIVRDFTEKIKPYREEIIIALIIVLSGLFGFGFGRLSKIEERKVPIKIEYPEETATTTATTENPTNLYYVASRNGTKYYFPWCDGAKKISPQNLVKFNSKEEAEKAGLTKAANCKGL